MQLANETELLYRALASPLGIVVSSAESALARQRLYRAKAEAVDDALAVLQIRVGPNGDGELWLLKGNKTAAPQTESTGTTLDDLGL